MNKTQTMLAGAMGLSSVCARFACCWLPVHQKCSSVDTGSEPRCGIRMELNAPLISLIAAERDRSARIS